MGLGIACVKLFFELHHHGFFEDIDSVMELGAQEIHTPEKDMATLLTMYSLPKTKLAYRSSTEAFYNLLGVKGYSCIDINEEHGAIKIDLNYPLDDKSLFGGFDFVTDLGSVEHVFNVGEAYRSMHRLCKPGGFIFCHQSLYQGNGFYLFEPAFFENMACANNYKILFSGLTIADYIIPCSYDLLEWFDWTKIDYSQVIGIMYLMQKQSDNEFRFPYQDNVLSEVNRNLGYKVLFCPHPISPVRSYIPMFEIPLSRGTFSVLFKKMLKRIMGRTKEKVK